MGPILKTWQYFLRINTGFQHLQGGQFLIHGVILIFWGKRQHKNKTLKSVSTKPAATCTLPPLPWIFWSPTQTPLTGTATAPPHTAKQPPNPPGFDFRSSRRSPSSTLAAQAPSPVSFCSNPNQPPFLLPHRLPINAGLGQQTHRPHKTAPSPALPSQRQFVSINTSRCSPSLQVFPDGFLFPLRRSQLPSDQRPC